MAANMDTAATGNAVTRAKRVAASVREMSDLVEQERELPAKLLTCLHDERLFRLLLPASLNGDQLDPLTLSKVTETIAAEDASTAWCLGQAAGCAMSAAFLDSETAQDVFGPANAVLAWGAGIQGKAIAVEGGYRVSGKWAFASGSRHATWLGGHSHVFEADGSPRMTADGRQVDRTALFPREAATILDDWHVVGLRGTGSDSYLVEDLFVPNAHTRSIAKIQTNSKLTEMSIACPQCRSMRRLLLASCLELHVGCWPIWSGLRRPRRHVGRPPRCVTVRCFMDSSVNWRVDFARHARSSTVRRPTFGMPSSQTNG